MADYTRLPNRFVCTGLHLTAPQDAMPPGKFGVLTNMRSYVEGSLQPRSGFSALTTVALAGPIHSLFRLNDATPFNQGVPIVRIAGSGANLYTAAPGANAFTLIDTVYSGNPLTIISGTPPNSPRPFAYVGDSLGGLNGSHKLSSDGVLSNWGISPPVNPPSAVLDKVHFDLIAAFNNAVSWQAAGSVATAPTDVNRVNTTIAKILYDVGAANSQALVNLTSMANVGPGTILIFGAETAVVEDIKIPVSPTTVQAIAYDVGATGLCTIQPANSLGTGQIEAPLFDTLTQDGTPINAVVGFGQPPPPGLDVADHSLALSTQTPTIRQLDFPVDCLITIGGELVRILSVAVGPDNLQSFRCSTTVNHIAGELIVGLPALRVWLGGAFVAGQAVTGTAIKQTLTPRAATTAVPKPTMVGGVLNNIVPIDLSTIGGRPTLPDDELHLTINVDHLAVVDEIRLYLNVDSSDATFTKNYYVGVFTASALATSVQDTNASATATATQAQAQAAVNSQVAPDPALRGPDALPVAPRGPLSPRAGDPVRTPIDFEPNVPPENTILPSGGVGQWVELRCRVSDLRRIGTDLTKTLKDVIGVEVLVQATGIATLTVQYSSLWLAGGFGPDIGQVGNPYSYWYRYRSLVTGAKSNPSPKTRGGSFPRRQQVTLTGDASADANVLVDWFRQGGTLATATYVGSAPNGAAFVDTFSDTGIGGGESLNFQHFRPWPTTDLPRTGVCTVVGTTVVWVSGDKFNTSWAPGSEIVLNGIPFSVYAQPSSTTQLQTIESAGAQTNIAFYVPGATLLKTALQAIGSGSISGVTYTFACGDPNNPGTVYWTNPNDIESVADINSLQVTDASEVLQATYVWDGIPFVASTAEHYQLVPDFGAISPATPFHPQITPCGRGFWTPWAWCLGPDGVYFLAKDGIYRTVAGGAAEPLTLGDLRPLFPTDGIPGPGPGANGYAAVDMTQTTKLKLTESDGYVIFDYQDVNGQAQTLLLEIARSRWFADHYGMAGAASRLSEPGKSVHDVVVGGSDGLLYQYGGAVNDGTKPFTYAFTPPWVDAGDSRRVKQFGDIFLDVNPGNVQVGFTVTPVYNNGQNLLPASVLGQAPANGRQRFAIDINNGDGQLAINFGIQVTGVIGQTFDGTPSFYVWEPSYVPKVEDVTRRASDWDDLGVPGAKFVQGLMLRANTYNVQKKISVEYEGGLIALTLTALHNGEVVVAYPNDVNGWTPFIAHLVRLEGADAVPWQFYGANWVYEPAPELATEWATQPTTHDLPGFLTVRDMLVAHQSTAPITLALAYDGAITNYPIPASGGLYTRQYLPIAVGKGKSVSYTFTSAQPFRLFKRDMAVRIQGWGLAGGYQTVNPFGGQSRVDGAGI